MDEERKLSPPYHAYHDLGIPELDTQHSEIIHILNQVSSLIFNKTEDATVIRLLNKVIEKTVLHYVTEEKLIKEYCTKEEATAHIAKHAESLNLLIALKNKLELDLIKYQIKYKADMADFTNALFGYDNILANRIKAASDLTEPGTHAFTKAQTKIEIE